MLTIPEALKTAVRHHQANRLSQAEQIYRQVLEIMPLQPDALHGLGLLAMQQGNFQNAQKFFNQAVEAQPNSSKHWFALGNCDQSQAEFSQAVDAYKKALAIDPNLAPIHNNLGYALQKLGKYSEAIASYKKALKLQPDCTEAYVNIGNTQYAQGKLSQDKQPHYGELNYKLGIARKQAGDLNNASNYYQQAIALQPENWETHYSLGIVLQEQEKFEKAIASYNQALKLNSENWDIYNRLGQIYQVQNKLTEALAIYRQGLNLLNPNYARAIKTKQSCAIQITPSIPQDKVKVGAYQFPAIPPVRESEKRRPFWTVVIPIYKRKDYVLECLANVLLQWLGEAEMEILVIDNSSESPLHELIDSLAGGIVNYYRNSENIGATNNMNVGISLSRGEWVHVLHDDDSVSPGFYSGLQQSIKDCPDNVGAACTGFEYVNDLSKTVRDGEINSGSTRQQKGILQNWLSRIGVCGLVMTPALVIRRTTHERLGGYSTEIPNINDWEIHKRIAAFYDWWYEPETLARFRVHSDTETSESWNSGKMALQVCQAIEMSDSYLPMDYRTEITAKARIQNFNYCLSHSLIPLKNNNLQGSLSILESALKIDKSSQSVAKLFNWLTQNDALPIREAIASKLIALNI
ncbi:MAG: tetratricopeptide repeat protein [Rivularia sp. (in: cyanobacteria)]